MDRTLYALVFGESVLNDAVAIVLYRTLLQFENTAVTGGLVAYGVFYFIEIFLGSVLIGVIVGMASAYLLKKFRIMVRGACCVFCGSPNEAAHNDVHASLTGCRSPDPRAYPYMMVAVMLSRCCACCVFIHFSARALAA